MGIVYRARDRALNRTVAIKLLLAGRSASARLRQRFQQEAETMARLRHPGIVQVLASGETEGIPYVVLEDLPNGNLAQQTHRAPQSESSAVATVHRLAQAVHFAHSQGIVHRDLKPSNVLLDAEGWPKVSDFGLAHWLSEDARLSRPGEAPGTPSYMSPEQIRGQISPHVDVYALGAILYELLTGRPPYLAETAAETMLLVQSAELTPPKELRPKLSRDLDAVCQKALEKDLRLRYRSADELAADLRRFLDGCPTVARPVGMARRFGKWARRRPSTAALIVVSVMALLLLASGLAWHSTRLGAALELAEKQRQRAEMLQRAAELNRGVAEQHKATANQFLYAARIRLAFQAWSQGDLNQTQQILAEYDQTTPRGELRGFEWYLLKGWCRPQSRRLVGHVGEVYNVTFSPDVRWLVSGGQDGTLRLWNPVDGAEGMVLRGHASCVNTLAFRRDGSLLASGSCDGTVRLWNPADWSVQHTMDFGSHVILAVAFSPDGRFLAIGGGRTPIHIWEVSSTPREVQQLDIQGTDVKSLAWSPDGKWLAASETNETTTRLWNTADWSIARDLKRATEAVVFSADSSLLAAADHPKFLSGVHVMDVLSGRWIHSLTGHSRAIDALAFSPDSKQLASAGFDRVIRLWTLNHYRLERMLSGSQGRIRDLAYSVDGRFLAAASVDGGVYLWDLGAHAGDPSTGAAPQEFAANDFRLKSGLSAHWNERDGVELRQHQTGERLSMLREWEYDHVQLAGAAPTAACIFANQRPIEVYSHTTQRRVALVDSAGRLPAVLSDDGQRLAAHDRSGRLRTWNTVDGQPIWLSSYAGEEIPVVLSTDGGLLTCLRVDADPAICIYHLSTGGVTPVRLESPGSWHGTFSHDGTLLAIADEDFRVTLVDVATGAVHNMLRNPAAIRDLDFSHDHRTLAVGLADRTVHLWHISTGQELLHHEFSDRDVEQVAFDPAGRELEVALQRSSDGAWSVMRLQAEPQ